MKMKHQQAKMKIKNNTQALGVLRRIATFNREAVDEDTRTVRLSFSSEEPYERWFGDEILGHEKTEVRLGRLQDGGPLLFNHDRDAHLGTMDEVSLESSRGQAVVRFGTGVMASEKFEDVKAGILQKVSVGYIVHRMVLEEENDDKAIYRVNDWEPLEVSLVTVPADNSVGVGRDAEEAWQRDFKDFETNVDLSLRTDSEKTEIIQPKHIEVKEMDLTPEEREKLERDARESASEKETARVREISALGAQHGEALASLKQDAATAIKEGASVEDFQRTVLEAMTNADPLDLTPRTHLDMTGDEIESFSLIKAINAHSTGNWKNAGFERECSIAIADTLGREAKGFFVPFDIQNRSQKRAMTVGGAATGAELVGTDHDGANFIDNLRSQALLGRLGAQVLPGLVGNLDLPRKTSSATFGFVAEDTGATLSDVGTGTLSLTPKILAGATSMSRSLLKQSAPSVEDMVMADLALGASLGVDLAGFNGSGAPDNPTGILNTTGIATSTILAPGSPTWAELVEFETDVNSADGLMGSLAYVTTAGVMGSMKTTEKAAGTAQFLMANGQANGYDVHTSSQLPANSLLFGNFNDVILAFWGVLDVVTDTATKVASGGLVLRVFSDCDVGVKHALSFSKNA